MAGRGGPPRGRKEKGGGNLHFLGRARRGVIYMQLFHFLRVLYMLVFISSLTRLDIVIDVIAT